MNERSFHIQRPHCNKVVIKKRVIYAIPLTCKRRYVGQTGRCIDVRLHELASSLKVNAGGQLAAHCRQWKCEPEFDQYHYFTIC